MDCEPTGTRQRQPKGVATPSMQRRTPIQHPPPTPSLNAIKRIRRTRGISTRTRLIGIDIGNDQRQVPTVPSSTDPVLEGADNEPEINPADVSSMIDAISKGVEAAIRNIFVNENQFPTPARNPRRKRMTIEYFSLRRKQTSQSIEALSWRKFVDCSRTYWVLRRTSTSSHTTRPHQRTSTNMSTKMDPARTTTT
ncbi:hypothetical protein BS17DRAFT_197945 [Gyrodon lividus]|nr:hypothetical protein BS17DRAFT_197945 [Gyrodon lividus]